MEGNLDSLRKQHRHMWCDLQRSLDIRLFVFDVMIPWLPNSTTSMTWSHSMLECRLVALFQVFGNGFAGTRRPMVNLGTSLGFKAQLLGGSKHWRYSTIPSAAARLQSRLTVHGVYRRSKKPIANGSGYATERPILGSYGRGVNFLKRPMR